MKNEKTVSTPHAVTENIIMQELEQEILIYNRQNNQALSLNKTAACVWQSCDGQRTIDQIRAEVSKQLATTVSEELIFLAFDELARHDLLADQPSGVTHIFPANGMKRREMIRRTALTTAAALPLITALAVPTAAQTASNRLPNGASCGNNDSICQSQCCFDGLCNPIDACFA